MTDTPAMLEMQKRKEFVEFIRRYESGILRVLQKKKIITEEEWRELTQNPK